MNTVNTIRTLSRNVCKNAPLSQYRLLTSLSMQVSLPFHQNIKLRTRINSIIKVHLLLIIIIMMMIMMMMMITSFKSQWI